VRRVALYALLAVGAVVLDTTWLPRVSLGGATADVVLVLVMTIGFLHGPEVGALVGTGMGLLQDLVTGVPLGLGMLAGLCVGTGAGLVRGSIYLESLWLPAPAAWVLTVVHQVVWIGAAHLVGLLTAPVATLARVVVLGACYNGAVAVPVFHGLRRLDDRMAHHSTGARPA
jgi:rod shape-determining protein MreD